MTSVLLQAATCVLEVLKCVHFVYVKLWFEKLNILPVHRLSCLAWKVIVSHLVL